jgi:hypothetical protein
MKKKEKVVSRMEFSLMKHKKVQKEEESTKPMGLEPTTFGERFEINRKPTRYHCAKAPFHVEYGSFEKIDRIYSAYYEQT